MLWLTPINAASNRTEWRGIMRLLSREFGLDSSLMIDSGSIGIEVLRSNEVEIDFTDEKDGRWTFDAEQLAFCWLAKDGSNVMVESNDERLLVSMRSARGKSVFVSFEDWESRSRAWALVVGFIAGVGSGS